MFASAVESFWNPAQNAESLAISEAFSLSIDPRLRTQRPVSILTRNDGRTVAMLAPRLDEKLPTEDRPQDIDELTKWLAGQGIRLNDPDVIFHFDDLARTELVAEADEPSVRRLLATDASAFAQFEAGTSEEDRDEAYVELDHWAVFGWFDGDRLVSAASAYPWQGSRVADIGVLTHPDARGRGRARGVVRTLSRHIIAEGHEPLYRCQLDNTASARAAERSGFTQYATWITALPD